MSVQHVELIELTLVYERVSEIGLTFSFVSFVQVKICPRMPNLTGINENVNDPLGEIANWNAALDSLVPDKMFVISNLGKLNRYYLNYID